VCFDNDEQSDVWAESIVKARKRWHCDECSSGILPGEHYQRIGSLYDGRWSTLRTCARCFWDRARVYNLEISEGCKPWESWCPVGYLHEHMENLAENERWSRSNGGEDESPWDEKTNVWDPSPITYRVQV